MLTLGVHDGHTATACLLEDGKVLACISEERINREKEWTGFPAESIKLCLKIAGKSAEEVDAIGVCSLLPQIGQSGYQNPSAAKKLFSVAARVLPRGLLQSEANIGRVQKIAGYLYRGRRRQLTADLAALGLNASKVKFFEHHELHAATAYYTSWYRDRKNLVVTLDGSGDGVCASLSVGENNRLSRQSAIFNYNSICDFYTRVTQFLGMRPMSHEYKVMGMAPYSNGQYADAVLEKFRGYFRVDPNDPLQIHNTSGSWKWQFEKRLRRDLHGARFDSICSALQTLFEEVCVEWIHNAVKKTGIGNLALSGGGFMNVKLNYLISQLPEVESLFVFPSCGDESNPVGAAILAALGEGFPAEGIEPLGMIDWGTSYDRASIEKAIDSQLSGNGVKISAHEDANRVVAGRLADGKIVGRMTGRMEWGARALGNRSILADPRKQQIIHKINKAIKMRDFWMPFAPAIHSDYRDRYIKMRKDYRCPFMTIAPETQQEAWDAITAGLHPFDKTARCQIVDSENHPSFHDLLSHFASQTGVGAVLNTSFNLHGDPVVMTPEDAIYTFLNSDLDVLQLEDHVVEKR